MLIIYELHKWEIKWLHRINKDKSENAVARQRWREFIISYPAPQLQTVSQLVFSQTNFMICWSIEKVSAFSAASILPTGRKLQESHESRKLQDGWSVGLEIG